MAMNLIRAGHDLTVNDLRRELADPHLAAGANWADSVQAVAEASELVFTSLPGPPEVEAVALGPGGILESAAEGQRLHRPLLQPADADPRDPRALRRARYRGARCPP